MIEAISKALSVKRQTATAVHKIRLAILCLPRPGGIAYYGALLANALSRHCEVMIVITEEMKDFSFEKSLKVACVRKRTLFSLPHPQSYREILRQVQTFAPHLVHDTSGNAFKWTFGLWPLIARRWPLVITEHDPQPHPGMDGFFAQFTRRVARHSAHHFIVHGKNSRQALLDSGVPQRMVSINRHGSFATYDRNRHPEVSEEENTVLFFGELRPNKGIYRLAEISRKVRATLPEARFVVAGRRTMLPSRRERTKVAAAVAAMQREPGFEVHDRFVSDSEVELLMRRCALVVLPYEEASQSGVIPVAYAFRKPVVAYDVGDLRESVVENQTGLLVMPGDEEAFAQAVISLLRSPLRRHALGQRALQWSHKELSWETIARRTMQDYQKLLVCPAN